MFELADSLLGVYKVDNMSYSIRIGVNNVVNKLKAAHTNENRPYLMGFDDHNSVAARGKHTTVSSSQATTAPLSSQATTVPLSQASTNTVAPANKKPSLDISAIQDPNASAQTERLSEAGVEPQTSDQNRKSSKDSGLPSGSGDNNGKNGIEDMDTGPDVFESSFDQEQLALSRCPVPLAASTPCASTHPKRKSRRQINDLSEVREEDTDDSDSDALSEVLSSMSNSQNLSQN